MIRAKSCGGGDGCRRSRKFCAERSERAGLGCTTGYGGPLESSDLGGTAVSLVSSHSRLRGF
ncbi:hypothetical protein A2U01_0047177, partial [Trifolium medium]|nr:hypothetical protein [Trifolium medium]